VLSLIQMEDFNITRVYADENGDSRFEDIAKPLNSGGDIGFMSEPEAVETIIFRKVVPGYDYDFHRAPARQYIILVDGEIQIETSLGEKRQFRAGDILLVEDTTGKGHRTRNLLPAVRQSIFVTLKQDTPS
jgi:quercetin dioxygenase-like cupin family protein